MNAVKLPFFAQYDSPENYGLARKWHLIIIHHPRWLPQPGDAAGLSEAEMMHLAAQLEKRPISRLLPQIIIRLVHGLSFLITSTSPCPSLLKLTLQSGKYRER